MEKQDKAPTDYKSLMQAQKEGLLVQSEREFKEEQDSVIENHIRQRQTMFDGFYGDMVSQKQRNEFYSVIDRESRKKENENNGFYPKAVRDKMEHVRELLNELRNLGVNEESIKELMRPKRALSRVVINADYRIYLPEYNGIEVTMGPLPKAVFLLFLRHPEGIVLKEIGDYFLELMDIYKVIMGRKFKEKYAVDRLSRICDPLSNSLNEKICRAHEALRKLLDDTVAASYFIQGKRSEARQILIPSTLIEWER